MLQKIKQHWDLTGIDYIQRATAIADVITMHVKIIYNNKKLYKTFDP